MCFRHDLFGICLVFYLLFALAFNNIAFIMSGYVWFCYYFVSCLDCVVLALVFVVFWFCVCFNFNLIGLFGWFCWFYLVPLGLLLVALFGLNIYCFIVGVGGCCLLVALWVWFVVVFAYCLMILVCAHEFGFAYCLVFCFDLFDLMLVGFVCL